MSPAQLIVAPTILCGQASQDSTAITHMCAHDGSQHPQDQQSQPPSVDVWPRIEWREHPLVSNWSADPLEHRIQASTGPDRGRRSVRGARPPNRRRLSSISSSSPWGYSPGGGGEADPGGAAGADVPAAGGARAIPEASPPSKSRFPAGGQLLANPPLRRPSSPTPWVTSVAGSLPKTGARGLAGTLPLCSEHLAYY